MNQTTIQEKILRGQYLNLASEHSIIHTSQIDLDIKQIFDVADKIFKEAKLRGYLE